MNTPPNPTPHKRIKSPLLLSLGALALVLALVLAAALALAGCGGGGGSSGYGGSSSGTAESAATKSTTAAQSTGSGRAVVAVAPVPGLGKLLVDSQGLTLYDFHKDKGMKSSCYTACAQAWPPLLTKGQPRPRNGAAAAKLGVTTRKDGSKQVTYAGHPLYTFTGDQRPGEANGNDVDAFGAEWYALHPNGADAKSGGGNATPPPPSPY